MKRAEELVFGIVVAFGIYSALATLLAVFAGELDAAFWYFIATVVCLGLVPAFRIVVFQAVGITDEDEDEEAHL